MAEVLGFRKTAPTFDFLAIGERLRAYRMARGLRSDDIAERLAISRAAVYNLERGEIVKIETLERLAALLEVTLPNLLGVESEYHDSAVSYFERMRQLESRSTRILANFDPISFLLTSEAYPQHLRSMLDESVPDELVGESSKRINSDVLKILAARRKVFEQQRPGILSLIGLRQIEQFLHHGLVGRLGLPSGVQLERKIAARKEVAHMIEVLNSDPIGVQVGIVTDNLPSETFQIFEEPGSQHVAVSPFRLGELPNVRTGIATITTSADAVAMYRGLIERVWAGSAKGRDGAKLLQLLLDRG
ncbi:helix-turn-helix transcriptional regulator [Paraburkholderia phytofirmans]|uniref:helix-turn-helix domain-containing protein n=1 Tax=Paraburkholderia sp. BL9I2N2 TaxID=1938809 RepID=UPI0010E21740|nr:helix-turn-helix transcriptional regulator [Paraburkholderia sp. BL9I2N2]TCK95712.1 transcriptional regulator with XRE-family HTH domain [Paraburkholderia sp. BL9I2N2]